MHDNCECTGRQNTSIHIFSFQSVLTYVADSLQAAYNLEAGETLPTFVISLYKSLRYDQYHQSQEIESGSVRGETYVVRKSA